MRFCKLLSNFHWSGSLIFEKVHVSLDKRHLLILASCGLPFFFFFYRKYDKHIWISSLASEEIILATDIEQKNNLSISSLLYLQSSWFLFICMWLTVDLDLNQISTTDIQTLSLSNSVFIRKQWNKLILVRYISVWLLIDYASSNLKKMVLWLNASMSDSANPIKFFKLKFKMINMNARMSVYFRREKFYR